MSNKTIRILTATINTAADSAGMTPENFVSRMRSISLGHKVCAHFQKFDGAYSIFICK